MNGPALLIQRVPIGEWALPDTGAGKATRLSYMTTVGSGAMDGDR
jgi:hypothetical protein